MECSFGDRGLVQCDTQFACEHTNHVLDANLVAADEHMVVLAVPYAFTALRKHDEIFVSNRGMHLVVDLVIEGPLRVVGGRVARHPAVPD